MLSSAVSPGYCQQDPQRKPSDRVLQFTKNAEKLKVTVGLDRAVYFPGEQTIVTVLYQNPTSQILEVPEPIQGGSGGFNVLEPETNPSLRQLGTAWRQKSAHPSEGNVLPDDARSRLVNPGDTLRIEYSSAEGCLGKKVGWNCTLPESQGEYQIEYTYSLPSAKAQFRIVWPKLEQWAQARLKPVERPQALLPNGIRTGKINIYQRYVRTMVLGYQNEHVLAVSLAKGTEHIQRELDRGGMFTGYVSRFFAPIRRLVTSSSPITSLQVTADASENVTISYTDQSGPHTLKLDFRRKPAVP